MLMGVSPSIRYACTSCCGGVPHSKSTTQAPANGPPQLAHGQPKSSVVGVPPTRRPRSSLCWWALPHSESTHLICQWVTPPLQVPTKFIVLLMGILPLRSNLESNILPTFLTITANSSSASLSISSSSFRMNGVPWMQHSSSFGVLFLLELSSPSRMSWGSLWTQRNPFLLYY